MSTYVTLNIVEITAETDAAFLIDLGDDDDHWIPNSQIRDSDTYEIGDDAPIEITTWLYRKAGLSKLNG